ncbi:TULP3, partial [Symbiodinium sp. KB8]
IAAYASESARSAASAVEEDASSDDEALAIFDRSAAGFTATQVQERQAAPHSPRSANRPAEAALGGASSAPAAASSAAGGGAESTMRSLLHTPVAPGKTLQCFVTRSKTGLGLGAPTWSLFLESTEEFLCAARKRSGQRSSNYLISRDAYPVDRKSPQVLGKVRGNVAVTASARRRELACIAFDYDRMGPGRMAVRVPQVSGSRPLEIRPAGEEDSMVAAVGDHPLARCVVNLRNKTPHWDERLQGHVLNFKGRVSQASVKNFQLETADQTSAADDCPLQFGRVDKHRFTLDVSWPLSPLQAFGIVLASLDPKLADTKSYDALKRSLEAAEAPSSDEEVAAAQGGGHSMLSRMFGSAGKK